MCIGAVVKDSHQVEVKCNETATNKKRKIAEALICLPKTEGFLIFVLLTYFMDIFIVFVGQYKCM